ncbi:MAG: HAD-IIIA family hydrolase [Rhodothermales bacterium]|nr:HAD-IIIA family hydrolase [Rhodothermales bacterium]
MKPRPVQAVVLAGGRGTRLAPITDTIPKPMVAFHGKPFLEHLIEMLRERGFRRVLLLLGYLPELVQNYFQDGSRWGVEIEYSVSAVGNDTGTRVKIASSLLDPVFLLTYCDNYWPMPFAQMWSKFLDSRALAQVTIYDNRDGYTRDNVRVDAAGFVEAYDKSRTLNGLQGVDIGFLIVKSEAIEMLPEGNVSLETALYPRLIANRQLAGFVTEHRYYSVSNHARLNATEAFLTRRPTVILDRDGVLNRKMPRAEYVRSWKDWQWLPGAKQALKVLAEAGYRVIVVTNQAGIARGAFTEQMLDAIHERMRQEALDAGGRIDAVYFCPHGWDENCRCRKPEPGMLFQAQRDFALDLSRVTFIGDDERDGQAAERANCRFRLVTQDVPLEKIVRELMDDGGMAA